MSRAQAAAPLDWKEHPTIMNITVFGASGAIGKHVVDLAAGRGHSVRAVYRTAPPVPPGGRVEILLTPDIFEPAFAAGAVRGADVVVTTLGPNFAKHHNPRSAMTSPPDLHQRLARTLVQAMRTTSPPTKLIAVSTASMGPADAVMGPGPRLLFRFFRTVVARNLRLVGQDLQAMERELAASALDWYAVRPVKLTDGPRSERVQAGERFALKTISRADVAWHILTLAEDSGDRRHRTPIIVSAGKDAARRDPQPPTSLPHRAP
jgi:nucleoside-diphosphate-sugar epimerase